MEEHVLPIVNVNLDVVLKSTIIGNLLKKIINYINQMDAGLHRIHLVPIKDA